MVVDLHLDYFLRRCCPAILGSRCWPTLTGSEHGRLSEWPMETDCKSVGVCLRRFESWPCHHPPSWAAPTRETPCGEELGNGSTPRRHRCHRGGGRERRRLCGARGHGAWAKRRPSWRKAGRGEHGGNSFYTAGAMRVAHAGLYDLRDSSTRTSGRTAPCCRRTPPRSTPGTWRGSPTVARLTTDRHARRRECRHSAVAARARAAVPADVRAAGLPSDRGDDVSWGGLAVRQHRRWEG